jgi:aminoglycoside phosphotransferase (APT) family kinase protein
MNIYSSDQSDERIFEQNIKQIVTERFGSRLTIGAIERNRFPYIGSYDCDLVTVRLSTGEQFRLFLKDYRISQKSKDEPELRRQRELRVYRDLLRGTDLGTPEYYGSVWDDSEGRFWILLEFVDGVVIKDHNVEHGILAADWLGRMQGLFAQRSEMLSACDFLIRQDADFFRSKAQLAQWNVDQNSSPSARRLSKIVDGYEQIIKVLETQPLTLVHGGYIPWHILLDFNCKPTRVCAVDWESAAFGPTLYDLAYFTYGMEPRPRHRLLDAYRRAAIQSGVPVPAETQMQYIVNCLRLHRIFDWLSRGLEKRFTEHKVANLVDRAEQLSATLHL